MVTLIYPDITPEENECKKNKIRNFDERILAKIIAEGRMEKASENSE